MLSFFIITKSIYWSSITFLRVFFKMYLRIAYISTFCLKLMLKHTTKIK